MRRIDQAGALLLEVELRGPSLEDVFIELTGRPWSAENRTEMSRDRDPELLNGWFRHLLLTIALNFASPQAIVYGMVPVFFLVAFGSVFRADSPPLPHVAESSPLPSSVEPALDYRPRWSPSASGVSGGVTGYCRSRERGWS